MLKSLITWAVRNSPAVNTLMVAVLLIGAGSFMGMRREVFPEFDLDIVLVQVPYPGASPEEVEEGICQKIEESVRSIKGIKKQTAVAQEGAGFVVLELETNVDVQRVLNEIRSEIDGITTFPDLAEDPEVEQLTFTEEAISVGILGPPGSSVRDELALREVAEKVRNDLILLPSISQADLVGTRDFQIDVEISEDTLRKYGLTLQQVAQIIGRENLELPGGTIRTESQELLLRGKNKRLTGAEIANIPLVTQENGVVLTADDLGEVRDAFTDDVALSEINGQPALVISVQRTRSEDLLEVVEDVKSYIARAELPPGYSFRTWADSSVDVRDRMNMLASNGLQGLLLVFLTLALFLDLRLSFWVAMGIPISVLGAGAVLLYMGHTLNMLSMFAFLMALGMVVDDAIVVGENVFIHRQRGASPLRAAVDGTYEVLPSVVASVSTTLIAYSPLLYVSGVMGKFIAIMPVAVIAMLVISLLEATFVLPCHLAHSGGDTRVLKRMRRHARRPWYVQFGISLLLAVTLGGLFYVMGGPPSGGSTSDAASSPANPLFGLGALILVAVVAYTALLSLSSTLLALGNAMEWLRRQTTRLLEWIIANVYVPTLSWSLRRPWLVFCAGIALFLSCLSIYLIGLTPFVLFPKMDSYRIEARVSYPDGTPAHVTTAATQKLADSIEQIAEEYERDHGSPLLRIRRRSVGQVRNPQALGPEARSNGSHLGSVEVELVPAEERVVTSDLVLDRWREVTGDIPGVESLIFGAPEMGPGGAVIEFKLLADKQYMSQLEQATELCKQQLATYQGVVDIRDDSRPGKWEYQLRVKEKAKAMGISLAQLAQTVRAAYYGEEVMRLQRGRHEVKLMVRYPEDERRSLRSLEEIRVRAADGAEYPLTELAHVDVRRGYSEINRVDQLRAITVTADVQASVGNASDIITSLQANFLPTLLERYPDLRVSWEGQQEQSNESVQSMMIGMGIALVAMFVLLTVEFRSYVQPVIVMGIIPFGLVGAIVGHAVMGLPLTLFSMFGLVALTGVVVNDSIVLIDFINARVRSGLPLYEAVVDAGARRLRPVLLTSVTTIAGLVPMLTESSFQAQFLIPLAATLVFGLSFSTVLVLVLIPTYYVIYRSIAGMPADEDDELVESIQRPAVEHDHGNGHVHDERGGRPAGRPAEYEPARQ